MPAFVGRLAVAATASAAGARVFGAPVLVPADLGPAVLDPAILGSPVSGAAVLRDAATVLVAGFVEALGFEREVLAGASSDLPMVSSVLSVMPAP
ncbi:hypothetical protein ASF58_08120 [Methylobacterium sp. Leaf125]|nr:hypothetical protein ASF58_08120 [Methylobacterium sp. Leaf125]